MIDDLVLGGAERQLVELANGLDKDRFDVTVVTLFPDQPLEGELRRRRGIRLYSLDRKGKFDFGILRKLIGIMRDRQIHVVQPFLTPATFFAFAAAARVGVPVRVMTERSGLRRDMGFGERLYQFAEDRLGRFVDAAVANSESGRQFLLSRGIPRRKTRVIYNGVSEERVTAEDAEVEALRRAIGLRDGAPVVGMVASLTPAKDYPCFLRAARLISQNNLETRFVIVGDGPLREPLIEMSKELGISDRVHFAGYQTRVAPFIKLFDVAVLTSRDYEGCSNYILEAMGIGTPVVATSIGGNPELVLDGETGWLVPPDSPQAVSDAVGRALQSPASSSEIVDRAQQVFRDGFSVPTMVAQYERLYEELLTRKSLAISPRPRDGVPEGIGSEGVTT